MKLITKFKTTRLIKECSKNGGYIVCFNHHEAERVFEVAKQLEMKIPFPITFYEFINKIYCGNNISKVYIDNVDLCLQEFSELYIDTITIGDDT